MKKLFTATLVILLSTSLYSKSKTEQIGDILQIVIPITAYGTTLYLDDKKGTNQFYKSYGTTLATTYVLKYTIKEKRPTSNSTDSFPSGHTSSTFAGASFIHKRYGFKYAVIPYVAAIYTGYSRVKSDKHYIGDVIAGAVIGISSSWYFTSPYKDINIEPIFGRGYKGLKFTYQW